MKKKYLLTPGPSPLAAEVKAALAKDIIHHRTAEFRDILAKVYVDLKYLYQTENPVLILTCSGTGAMEASIVNFLNTKSKILVINGGKFGQRWGQLAKAYNIDVVEYNLEWGKSPDIKEIKNILTKNPDISAVYTTLCETSTATVYDIKTIAELTNSRDILLVVDAISGIGQDVLKTDEWGVDVVVAGSQKGLMLPPGLAFISVSKRAEKYLADSDLPKYYFNLSKALKSYAQDDNLGF